MSRPPGLSLTAAPGIVDVGYQVLFSLRAREWPAAASVSLGFISLHHGFSGAMTWNPSCTCFQVSVQVVRRIHSLESARAEAKVTIGDTTFSAAVRFTVRGLAKNGHDYARGGSVVLGAWVADPQPTSGEQQHYCAWIHTLDGLGVPGYATTFVVHFQNQTVTLRNVLTGANGVACVRRSVGNSFPGIQVRVDVYGAGQHRVKYFTPR